MEVFSHINVPTEECDVHNLYIRNNSDGSVSEKVFVNLPSEYNGWIREQQLERPTPEWTKVNNIYAYNMAKQNNINNTANRMDNTINTENNIAYNTVQTTSENIIQVPRIKERLSIKEPTDNSVYKIDSTLPLEYQNIFISSYIPKNIVSAKLYCDNDIIGNIDDLKKDYIRWNLKQGSHTFYIEAETENGEIIKSSTVKIYVQ